MILLKFLTLFLPWPVRRWVLAQFFGFKLHPNSRIGLAWIFPKQLIMEAHSRIGHFTVCKDIALLRLGEYANIGRGNWITGYPIDGSRFFLEQIGRKPQLVMGEHSAITNQHLIDCTNAVTIGAFATFAGFRSQILTHSINLESSRQSSAPIVVGKYTFVGTDCVLLGGSVLPDYSILGAKSVLNKKYSELYWLYAGTPARPVKQLGRNMAYFSRKIGEVD